MVTVTVNGVSVKQYVKEVESAEKSKEIANFLRDEFRSMGRISHRHQTSGGARNVSKPVNMGNGYIACR